jgi:hypothetical protein
MGARGRCDYCDAMTSSPTCASCADWIVQRAAALVNLFDLDAVDASATARRDRWHDLHPPHEKETV